MLLFISSRYHHLAPHDLLEAGREPVNVKADGTCLFRSVSVSLYGDEIEIGAG